MTAASISVQSRRRTAAALAAAMVGAVALLIPLQSGASAAPAVASPAAATPAAPAPAAVGQAAAPVTTAAGTIALTVDPASGLTAAGATLKVTGRGFPTGTGIYLAICHADGKAPASLKDCVGGAIPTSNTSKSWAHITNKADTDSPVVSKWGTGSTFAVELALPKSDDASDALDCSKVPCAVYTRPDTGQDTAEQLSIPLVYAAPVTTSSSTPPSATTPSSTPTSTSPPSSSAPISSSAEFSTSSAVVATTVQAKSVRSPKIEAGGAQEVLFAGFDKNEPVTVTLYSAPQSLPAASADADGVVKIDFTVPANLEQGTHLLKVVGQNSKVTGIASFVVTPPVVASSAVVVPSTPATTAPASSAPASSAVVPPLTLSSAASSATVSSAVAPIVPPASSGKVVWPWYALGALLGVLAGVIAYLLTRRSRLAAERRENDALLADAAAAEHERNLDAIARANADAPTQYLGGAGPAIPPPPMGGYAGYHPGEHGLLAGRDHPDSPGLLSGTGYRQLPPVDQPTTYLPDGGTTQLPADRTTQLPGDETTQLPGNETTQLPGNRQTPTGDDAPGGPATRTWRPNFDDDTNAGDTNMGDSKAGETNAGDTGAGNTRAGDTDAGENPDPPAGGRHSRPS